MCFEAQLCAAPGAVSAVERRLMLRNGTYIITPSLGFVASGNESQDCREERLRFRSPLQGCPPHGHLARADLACLHGLLNRCLVESLIDGEPGRSREAKGVRDDSDVAQASPLE